MDSFVSAAVGDEEGIEEFASDAPSRSVLSEEKAESLSASFEEPFLVQPGALAFERVFEEEEIEKLEELEQGRGVAGRPFGGGVRRRRAKGTDGRRSDSACQEGSDCELDEGDEEQLAALLETSVRQWGPATAIQSPHSFFQSLALGLFFACFFLLVAPTTAPKEQLSPVVYDANAMPEGVNVAIALDDKSLPRPTTLAFAPPAPAAGATTLGGEVIPFGTDGNAASPTKRRPQSQVVEAFDLRAARRRDAVAAAFPEDLLSRPASYRDGSEAVPGHRFLASLEYKGVLRLAEASEKTDQAFQQRVLHDARVVARRYPHVLAKVLELPSPTPGGVDEESLASLARFFSLKLRIGGDSPASVAAALQLPVGVQEVVFWKLANFLDAAEMVAEATEDLEDSWGKLNGLLQNGRRSDGAGLPALALFPNASSSAGQKSRSRREEEEAALAELHSASSRCVSLLQRMQLQLDEGVGPLESYADPEESGSLLVAALKRVISVFLKGSTMEDSELHDEAFKALGALAGARSRFQEALVAIQTARLSSAEDADLSLLVEESRRRHAALDESRLAARDALRVADLPLMFANFL